MELPTKYDQVCALLAELKSIDDIKDVREQAIAMQGYATRASNKELAAHAAEYRARSERRLGELMSQAPKAKGAIEPGTNRGTTRGIENPTSYASLGISKNLAKSARAAWAMTSEEFEQHVAKIRGMADALADGFRAAVKVARSVEVAKSKARRKEKHKKIAAESRFTAQRDQLPRGPFALIYADPPWKWGHFGEQDKENEAGKDRTPDQHYPTLTYDEIKAFKFGDKPINEIAHEDAALFLWCTSANLKLAIEVMEAWGFEYKTHAVWDKQISGLGLVFRNQHEVLLYGTRGNMPGPQYQPPSVFSYLRAQHSAKPPEIRAVIDQMYPDFKEANKLELFARGVVDGWHTYGFEAHNHASTAAA